MRTLVTTHAGFRRRGPRTSLASGSLRAQVLRGVVLVSMLVTALLVGAVPADAAPAPSPAPPAPVVDAACVAKAPGSVAWCMPWAVHVDTPPPGARSHWITQCSKAASDTDRRSCALASITLETIPRDGTASVLMDGPSTGAGPTGLIGCGLLTAASPGSNPQQDAAWTTRRAECSAQAPTWAAQLYDPDPKQPDCAATDVSCKVNRSTQEALSAGVRSGIQGLVDVAVLGTVFLLSKLAGWVFKVTAISSPDEAFYSTYNSVAGMLVVLIFLFFILSTVINGLRTTGGPSPLATLGGLVRAVLGITFAGGIAYTIVAAWDQATNAVIEANARTPYDPSQLTRGLTALTSGVGTLLLALLLSVLAMIGLLLLFIFMLFRGLLATGAALFGAMAMTGQVMHETRHWGRRWFWTVNALGSSKFFIAELWIYGSRSAYQTDDVMNALRAVLLIWLMVAAPWILLRLTTMWDGYLSDVNAHGLMSTAGNPLQLSADFVSGARSGAADASGPSSGPGSGAAGVMDANTATVATSPAEAAGIGEGKGRDAADAAGAGADGGNVGEPAQDPTTGQQEQSGAGDEPNAQETDGIQAGGTSAQHDVAAGQVTAPGDATGSHGSLPVTPAGAQSANPTGDVIDNPTATAEGAGAGESANGPTATGPATGTGTSGPAGDGAADARPPGEPAASPDDASGPPQGDNSSPEGEQPAARSGGAAAGGGSEGTAAAAAI